MVGHKAYAKHCAAYNDCSPDGLPRFASDKEYLEHGVRMQEEEELMLDHEAYGKFISDSSAVVIPGENN